MPDLGPNKKRIAQLFRMLGSSGGERRNAWHALVREMQKAGVNWTDIGDVIEPAAATTTANIPRPKCASLPRRPAQKESRQGSRWAWRAQAMERQWAAHAAEAFWRWRNTATTGFSQLKDDKQRDFVSDMCVVTQRRTSLSQGQLAYLASIYIQIGGKALAWRRCWKFGRLWPTAVIIPIPATGKVPPFSRWQKIENVSHSMLEAWDRNWPRASNTGILTKLHADARRRYSQRACRDRDRGTGMRTI